MKKFLLLFSSFLIITFLTSCDKEQKPVKQADQRTILYTSIDTVYEHEEICNVLCLNEDIFTFLEKFNIEQYKIVNNTYYTIVKTSSGLYLVLFDCSGKHSTINEIKFSPSDNEKDFEFLKIGMTLNDVQACDPNGNYDFLVFSWKKYPQISYHFFENGNAYCIQYQNQIITDIIMFTL